MTNKEKRAISIYSLLLVVMIAGKAMLAPASATSDNVCPQDGGWVKIDSSNLSLYPVAGATQYCFKAGSDNAQGCIGGKFDAIPDGGFNQPYCGLSHWSYYIPSASPSPSVSPSPEASPSPSIEPSPSTSPNPSPSPSPVASPSPAPESTPIPGSDKPVEQQYEELERTRPAGVQGAFK